MKIPIGKSEAINRRRTGNTMVKRKGQMDKQWSTKYYRETSRLSNTNSTQNRDERRWFEWIRISHSTSGILCFASFYTPTKVTFVILR